MLKVSIAKWKFFVKVRWWNMDYVDKCGRAEGALRVDTDKRKSIKRSASDRC